MKCRQLVELLERLAPPKLAESWDNTGLSFGNLDNDISNIMIALEPSEVVINQAIEQKVDVILTHHPMIFKPIKQVSFDSLIGRKIINLAYNNIVTYSMHTNMDIAVMACESAKMLGLKDVTRLEITDPQVIDLQDDYVGCSQYGLGSVGLLEKDYNFKDYIDIIKKKLNINFVRTVGDEDAIIRKVAILPGSGKSFIKNAINNNVDVLITGDIDYHSAVDAYDMGLCIIDAGHFETEYFFTDFMEEFLKKQFSIMNENDIRIIRAVEKSPIRVR